MSNSKILDYSSLFLHLQTKYVNETDDTMQAIFNNTMDILINLSNLKFPFFSVCIDMI